MMEVRVTESKERLIEISNTKNREKNEPEGPIKDTITTSE